MKVIFNIVYAYILFIQHIYRYYHLQLGLKLATGNTKIFNKHISSIIAVNFVCGTGLPVDFTRNVFINKTLIIWL